MKWLLGVVFIIVLLKGEFAFAVLMAVVYWLYLLARTPSKPASVVSTTHSTLSSSSDVSTGDLVNLMLLKLELQRLDSNRQVVLNTQIDTVLQRYFADLNVLPDNALWQQHRAAAWDLLNRYADTPLGLPPWHNVVTETIPNVEVASPPVFNEISPAISTNAAQPVQFTIDETEHSTVVFSARDNKIAADKSFHQYTWHADEPSGLERVLTKLSSWHSLAIPFLAQNIGWFIGVFCFIAGSLFLVSYSTGYTKNLIAFFSFFIFTLALLFGGYQMRRKRPELITSSDIIFVLSALLIPLTNIAATQLLFSSDGLGLQLVSALLVAVELGAFYVAITLVAGVLERSLQQRLPPFFIALTAMQLLQLAVTALPVWQLVALIHLTIFALLSVSIYLFIKDWLQAIFQQQDNSAYFAAGILVYAAVLAFVFNSAVDGLYLPDGYYGVFLLLLSGLLFFVDVQLKNWQVQHAYLSRFSFLLYGLSVLGLCLTAPYSSASALTLLLAIALYGFIIWHYLSLIPLTIFLACAFWLYGLLVLQQLPADSHLLASLPVLLGLYRLANWAVQKRQSANLALIVLRVLYSLLAVLTVWSLAHSTPSLLAMTSTVTAAILVYLSSQRESAWFYSIALLAVLTVYHTPLLFGLQDTFQFALGLLLLSVIWSYFGVHTFLTSRHSNASIAIAHYLNSGLASLLLALLPLLVLSNVQRIIVLLLAGAIALVLSYQLLARWLFYAVLLLWAAAIALAKITYYPPPSTGLASLSLGIVLWFWLWRAEKRADSEFMALRRTVSNQKLALLPDCYVFNYFRLPSFMLLFSEVMHTPLERSLFVLWLVGMTALFGRLLDQQYSYALLAALLLAGTLSKLLIIRYLWLRLFPLPVFLILTALLLWLTSLGLSTASLLFVAVLYALFVWQYSVYCLKVSFVIKLTNALNPLLLDEKPAIIRVIHHTAFFIVWVSLLWQVLASGLFNPQGVHSFTVLLTLLLGAGFFALDKCVTVRYGLLICLLLAQVEAVSLLLHVFSWQTLASDSYAGLLLVLLAVGQAGFTLSNTRYAQPAASLAMVLALCAVVLQCNLLLLRADGVMVLDYVLLLMAGGVLWQANKQRLWLWCCFATLLLWVAAAGVFLSTQFHGFALQTAWVLFGFALSRVRIAYLFPYLPVRNAYSIFTPWLALGLVVCSPICWLDLDADYVGIYSLELFAYALLMLRYSAWTGFVWLAATAFMVAGVAFNFETETLPINLLLWSNGQLLLIRAWQHKGAVLATYWQWQQRILAPAFSALVLLVLWLYLLVLTLFIGLVFFADNGVQPLSDALPIALLLTVSFGHLLSLRFSRFSVHGLGYSVLLLLHGWVFLWLDAAQFLALLPWYALQAIVLSGLIRWLVTRQEKQEIHELGERYSAYLVLLSVLQLGAHGVLFRYWLTTGALVPVLFAPLDRFAALLTGLLIVIIGVRELRSQPDATGWYSMVLFIGALGFYGRLCVLGVAPISLWDTAVLIVFAYSLFFLHRVYVSKPLFNTALFLPVLALATVPLQLASAKASLAFLLSGLLYVFMRRETQQKTPLYLALVAFNAGVYLWVPQLVNSHQLLQIYVMPAALTVLLLLQLHQRELKPSVLMGSRLMAVSSIYACATVDVFLRAELSIFILAIALSIAGIVLGIALRTRAFLYAGVSFLLLNVLGQLLRFYPEQAFGKAIVLMVLGASITGVMIWFNIQRVAILQRVYAIQAQMQTWE